MPGWKCRSHQTRTNPRKRGVRPAFCPSRTFLIGRDCAKQRRSRRPRLTAPERMPDTTRISVPERALPGNTSSKPSKIRWLVLLLISLMYMITYMDRTGISIAAPAMAKEFGLGQTAVGIVFSVFLWAYAIGQIPLGWLADPLGPRLVTLVIDRFWALK